LVILIFAHRWPASVLAHVGQHRVSGLTLHPDDANCTFSLHSRAARSGCEEEEIGGCGSVNYVVGRVARRPVPAAMVVQGCPFWLMVSNQSLGDGMCLSSLRGPLRSYPATMDLSCKRKKKPARNRPCHAVLPMATQPATETRILRFERSSDAALIGRVASRLAAPIEPRMCTR